MLSPNDTKQLFAKNITEQQVAEQLAMLKKGTVFAQLVCPATIGMGIRQMDESERQHYIKVFENDKEYYRLVKFVPASGAASRMFKDLFSFIEQFEDQPFQMIIWKNTPTMRSRSFSTTYSILHFTMS